MKTPPIPAPIFGPNPTPEPKDAGSEAAEVKLSPSEAVVGEVSLPFAAKLVYKASSAGAAGSLRLAAAIKLPGNKKIPPNTVLAVAKEGTMGTAGADSSTAQAAGPTAGPAAGSTEAPSARGGESGTVKPRLKRHLKQHLKSSRGCNRINSLKCTSARVRVSSSFADFALFSVCSRR